MKQVTEYLRRVSSTRGRMAERLAARADAARDLRQFRNAGVLYHEAVALAPEWSALQVQAGHMFKEAGDHAEAESHYLEALSAMPGDADLALQLGHFYKMIGRSVDALEHYHRAVALAPDWHEAALQLAAFEESGAIPLKAPDTSAGAGETSAEGILPELLPGNPIAPAPAFDVIEIRRLGARRERSAWGMLPMISGVEALRGVCVSRASITAVEVTLDGKPFLREPVRAFPLHAGATKYVFNLWYDVSAVEHGLHLIEVRMIGAGPTRLWQAHVVVAGPLAEADHPQSDALVTLDPGDRRSVVEQVRSRPSVVHRAADRLETRAPAAILVLRTDQLGDMVVSLPAVRRLRQAFPAARIVGLTTTANADLARVCGLFDEVLVAEFPDVVEQRRRTMTHAEQSRLRELLHGYRFDLAVDLSLSGMSRPLLLLTGAKRLFGFGDADWPWLSAGFEGRMRDPKNDSEDAPQSSRILSMIERIVTLYTSAARIERREDLHRGDQAALGLPADARYAVIHAGARIAFSRWPGYPELIARFLADSELHVVLLGAEPETIARARAVAGANDRLHVVEGVLPFDRLDALLQFATLFVGNDSGPKHLAALRGAPVVSVHSARINWREWGQEQTGVIVSRRVPCAGCTLYHDVEECGKDFVCVTDITVDEVYAAARELIGAA